MMDDEATCMWCWRSEVWVVDGLCDQCRWRHVSGQLSEFPVSVKSSEWIGI